MAGFCQMMNGIRLGRQCADSRHSDATTSAVAGAGFCMRFNLRLFGCSENQSLGAKIVKDATPEKQQLLRVGMVNLDADLKKGFNSSLD